LLSSVTGTETTNYTYDDNGNITGMGDRTLTYNEDNRLVSVVEDSVTLGEYVYNGLGQRITKEVDSATTVFHYDFDGNIIGESDTSGDFSKEYLYRGSSRLALVDVSTANIYYYGNDQLGTPQILTDSTNTVVWEAIYKPFGEAEVNSNSTVENNFRFPGQYYDQETGLHYNYHRYYNPSTGRYLTPDPIGQTGGLNIYLYANNNPINLLDPGGMIFAYIYPMSEETECECELDLDRFLEEFYLKYYNIDLKKIKEAQSALMIELLLTVIPRIAGIPPGFVPPPKRLPAFSGLRRVKPKTPVQGGRGLRPRWKDQKGNIFEWDSQHGRLEMYNKRGKHLGEFDPNTGIQTKQANPSYSVEP
jgi:RHS repeat-associated protein